jgi:hypothetical protein
MQYKLVKGLAGDFEKSLADAVHNHYVPMPETFQGVDTNTGVYFFVLATLKTSPEFIGGKSGQSDR